jgi:hypothetical protein
MSLRRAFGSFWLHLVQDERDFSFIRLVIMVKNNKVTIGGTLLVIA